MGLLSEFSDLFLPRRCAGCGRETVSLCTTCLMLLGGIPRAMEPRYGTLPVVGVSEYNSRVSHMVVNFKDNGRRDVLDPLERGEARAAAVALAPPPDRGVVLGRAAVLYLAVVMGAERAAHAGYESNRPPALV